MTCVLCGAEMAYAGIEQRQQEDSGGAPVEYDLYVCTSKRGRCSETTWEGKPGTRRLVPRAHGA